MSADDNESTGVTPLGWEQSWIHRYERLTQTLDENERPVRFDPRSWTELNDPE
jgi:hypothetical protein